jgi:aminopeptidase YwaD
MPKWDVTPATGWRRGAQISPAPRASRWLAALLALALLVPAAARADTPPAADEPTTAATPSAFSGAEAFRHVAYLADRVGSRTAGSDKEGDAATYLAGEMARFGLQTEVQLFPVQLYDERTAVVTPLAPAAAPIETAALMYSGSGTVAGELVDAGLGRPSDWAAGGLQGKVALLERGELTFSEKVSNVAEAGAVAAIIFNQAERSFSGTLRTPAPIPVVTLGRQEGQALRDRVARGSVLVEVAVDADVVTRQSRNVIGRLPGSRPGAIVIGGHFDSVAAGPGANDNASGTATMLELARVFSERHYPYTLYFVAFGSEEVGLRGSRHFVDALPEAERAQIRAMVNLDMVGVGDEQRLTGTTEIVDVAREVATAIGIPRFSATGGGAGASSDHESFQRAGIPILFIHRTTDPNYHSPGDRAEYVDPAYLALAGQLAVGVLDRLAADER